jgi:hypothetical protein
MTTSLDRTTRFARENGPGVVGSLLLHVIIGCLAFLLIVKTASQQPPLLSPFVPVQVVQLAQETTSPVHEKDAVQQPRATHASREVPTSPRRPVAVSPTAKRPFVDDLEIRLKKLARLRQPDTDIALPDDGASDATATGNGASHGEHSAYSLRDFLRAQVERRWSLDLSRLEGRNLIVPIHVVVARNGEIKAADIVERERSANDAAYREVALSARNAVLLSSPIQWPAGQPRREVDITLLLNPKDVLR